VDLTSQPPRILLVANDDDQAQSIRSVLAASTTPRFLVDHASNAWEAQRQAVGAAYEALVLDDSLSGTDGETLLGRLKALGVGAPALLLTSAGWNQVAARGDDSLSRTEALHGNTLVRAIVAMIQRHALTQELAAARDQIARATAEMAELTHDLATPLGVVMGLTQVLLSADNGLNTEGRSYLEDVSREALRAGEILKRVNHVERGAGPGSPLDTRAPDLSRATGTGPGTKMVLIADDDPATRRLVCATLASDQYSVLEAADGREAWRLIREHHPAVAILDWQMPVYSGLELTDVIKGDPRVRNITVIMLTGRSAQADREAGARARADLYLIKPFSPQELLEAVEKALGVNQIPSTLV
jgi:DNA-binding response OmpR family regulator